MVTTTDWSSTKTRHGTNAGAVMHSRLGERPCVPCYLAKKKYDQERILKPKVRTSRRIASMARGRALARLGRRHSDEYQKLYQEEKLKLLEERDEND